MSQKGEETGFLHLGKGPYFASEASSLLVPGRSDLKWQLQLPEERLGRVFIEKWALLTTQCTEHDRSSPERSKEIRRASPLGAVERLINKPGIVLRIIHNGILGVGIAKLVNLGLIPRADGEPVLVGIVANFLALVEVADRPITEYIATEVDGNLLVEVDILAVLVQALHAGRAGILGSISLCRVRSVRRPGVHRQRDCLGDLLEQEAVWHCHRRGAFSCSDKETDSSQ